MTREEAQSKREALRDLCHEDGLIESIDMFDLINKIYDDFDADMKLAQKIIEKQGQTCESCRRNTIEYDCRLVELLDSEFNITNPKDFGCSQWESK